MAIQIIHRIFALPTNGKKVKRWTVDQSHFLVARQAPSCETEGTAGKDFGYV
ncbi:MAG: hypothetical protein K6C30_00420 [Bacteroidaceae bacterium]|nr:hypothetical protein [Bacteroidaceae bacterium]